MVHMTPTRRKIIYAISFETLGIAVAALGLTAMTDATAAQSLVLSTLTASIALIWSFGYNSLFEAWEARQAIKGRSPLRRAAHALMFEMGLIVLMIPVMAWWLGVGLLQALAYEAGLIALFILYTYVFTWGFDRLFGLPDSARQKGDITNAVR